MGALILNATRIQATGAHIQWVHHVPVDGALRLRGHGSLTGALDTTMGVEKLTASGSQPLSRTMTARRMPASPLRWGATP